jgi:hypothetical protein
MKKIIECSFPPFQEKSKIPGRLKPQKRGAAQAGNTGLTAIPARTNTTGWMQEAM